MLDYPLISVYTQVYNTQEKDLRQCVESVLGQTYTNFEYFILDNGSTDGSKEILKEYSARDSRVHLSRTESNRVTYRLDDVLPQMSGAYFAELDSDDWWEPDYLARMLSFLQDNGLDLALTGTQLYREPEGSEPILRSIPEPQILSLHEFARNYPRYWTFPSTVWASLTYMPVIRETEITDIVGKGICYGSDTIIMLRYIEKCNRIGIDNSVLYHYRIRSDSVSYIYNSKRFEANLAYCDQMRKFLERHTVFDDSKAVWLKQVYLNSICESVRLALGAKIPLHEKLTVCGEIVSYPKTAEVLQLACDERTTLLNWLRQFAAAVIRQGADEDLRELLPILRCICPRCGAGITEPLLLLCQKELALIPPLLEDDVRGLSLAVLRLVIQKHHIKQFNLPNILAGLLPENPLSLIRDGKFYRNYPELCADVLQGNLMPALEYMTGALIEHQISRSLESYLKLYLTIAAMEEQAPAFLFGKVQLAQVYLNEKRYEDCQAILQELDQMGMKDHEDILHIKKMLKSRPD